MPKVRRSRKQPPDGWELIEPTLEELEQKMREGLFGLHHIQRQCLVVKFPFFQPKLNLTKENVSTNHFGQFSKFIIKNRVTFMIYSIVEKPSVVNFTITVSPRKLPIPI